jgi:AcrR family transcriptional regulator
MTTQTDAEGTAPQSRMRAEDRRELILEAATSVFGDHGYVGATTDMVARAAGVSQPYVVRMFGTKEKLFLEVLHRALGRLLDAFRTALAADPSPVDLPRRLGAAYVGLVDDRGILISLMHGFVLGADVEIGAAARWGFLRVWDFLRDEAGLSVEESQRFLADGMLINTMIGIRMSDEYHSSTGARELLDSTFPLQSNLDTLLAGSASASAAGATAAGCDA